jgi:TPR repeat protein
MNMAANQNQTRQMVLIGGTQIRAIAAAENAFEAGNYADAFRYYNAEANHPNPNSKAFRMIGEYYRLGYRDNNGNQIVEMNPATALYYYQRAIEHGDVQANNNIRLLNIVQQPRR